MPQVDLENLVSACAGGGGDRKITCETLADDSDGEDLPEKVEVTVADVPSDFPPESFWLSRDAEIDWFDRNAFLERKESTKGISNSTNLNTIPSSNSNSQRFSVNLKSKASIIGLPKTQKTNYIDCKRRNNKPANVQLFPNRNQSVGKTVSMAEPSSPKVSCMGRVRSKRGRRRSCENIKTREKSVEKSRSGSEKRKKKGFYSRVLSMFKSGGRDGRTGRTETGKIEDESTVEEAPRKSVTIRMREFPVCIEPVAEPPGLGGVKKFASGRRSGSWSTDDFDVAMFNSSGADGPTK